MKTRIVYTKFWDDRYIGNLAPTEKLLFLYLITNSKIGLTGIYECPNRIIQFETGLNSSQIKKTKRKFTEDGKFFFCEGWVKVQNVDKYQVFKGKSNEVAKKRELELVPKVVQKYFDRVSTGCRQGVDTPSNKKQETRNKKQETKNKKTKEKNKKKKYNSLDKFVTDLDEILVRAEKLYPNRKHSKAVEDFIGYCRAKNKMYADFRQAYFNWVRTDRFNNYTISRPLGARKNGKKNPAMLRKIKALKKEHLDIKEM